MGCGSGEIGCQLPSGSVVTDISQLQAQGSTCSPCDKIISGAYRTALQQAINNYRALKSLQTARNKQRLQQALQLYNGLARWISQARYTQGMPVSAQVAQYAAQLDTAISQIGVL